MAVEIENFPFVNHKNATGVKEIATATIGPFIREKIRAKSRLILDEMCRLYGKFTSYLRRVLCKTRLIFSRINGPNITVVQTFQSL